MLLCVGCGEQPSGYEEVGELPAISPNYTGVTIPVNIAPLNFYLTDSCEKAAVRLLSERWRSMDVRGMVSSFFQRRSGKLYYRKQ